MVGCACVRQRSRAIYQYLNVFGAMVCDLTNECENEREREREVEIDFMPIVMGSKM